MAVAATGVPHALHAPTCCRLTTFSWSGAAVDTYTQLGFANGRAYVRLAATSPALERIWNTARARIVPCTPGGRPYGSELQGLARVLAEGEEVSARQALLDGRPADGLTAEDDLLYVEIAPLADGSQRRAR
jgi:hypothetical protein